MGRINTGEPLSKQSDFKSLIQTIQSRYIRENGWSSDWFLSKWPHITKLETEHLNLTEQTRRTVEDWENRHQANFPWHSWRGIRSSRNFHSSQVIALAVLGAFINSGRRYLKEALVSVGLMRESEEIQTFEFEYEPPNYFNEPRRTSVDFMIGIENDVEKVTPIYFEVKFLEASFGSCSRRANGICNGLPDSHLDEVRSECQLTKEGIRYWDALDKLFSINSMKRGCSTFNYRTFVALNVNLKK